MASPLADTRALALDAQGLERLKQQAGRDPGRAVGEAAQQFEGLLLNMMLKSMRQAGGQDGMFDTEQSKLYTSMFDQQIAQHLAKRGIGLADVLKLVEAFRKKDAKTPIVLMGYANPIEAMGVEKFVAAAKAAGVDGVIVVDYPPEECGPFTELCGKAGIDCIFLLAPTSTDARIREVARSGTGYLYYVSLKGVTGVKTADAADIATHLPRLRAASVRYLLRMQRENGSWDDSWYDFGGLDSMPNVYMAIPALALEAGY